MNAMIETSQSYYICLGIDDRVIQAMTEQAGFTESILIKPVIMVEMNQPGSMRQQDQDGDQPGQMTFCSKPVHSFDVRRIILKAISGRIELLSVRLIIFVII